MKRHLLVTNDFPPKVGGIQQYLWELWSRLDPTSFVVLTASSDKGALRFDAEQKEKGFRIERVHSSLAYFPTFGLSRQVQSLANEVTATLVLFDPVVPLGLLGCGFGPFIRALDIPYGVVLHGAEVTVPGRIPAVSQLMGRVLKGACIVISAGGYPAKEAVSAAEKSGVGGEGKETLLPIVTIPPGVDTTRFVPLSTDTKRAVRARLGLEDCDPLIASVSRLVPRKGMDVLISAAKSLALSHPQLTVAIAGGGRDEGRLASLAASSRLGDRIRLLGRISEEDKVALLGAADLFVMACRNRWMGLEQEGFGIVFAEAGACGVPSIAGTSGGASEAVEDGVTGLILPNPKDPEALCAALRTILADRNRLSKMGRAARRRAVASFGYDVLAPRLGAALEEVSVRRKL